MGLSLDNDAHIDVVCALNKKRTEVVLCHSGFLNLTLFVHIAGM